MAETKMAVEKEIGLFAHLCRQRNGAAKVFPHCGEKGDRKSVGRERVC